MVWLEILAVVLALVGIVGSVVPGIAGPPFGWLGLFVLYLAGIPDPISVSTLLIFLGVAALLTVLDYVLPPRLTRTFGGHKAASIGATIGLFAGMFFTPIGMIGGSLLGAFIAELVVEDSGVWESFKASLGTFLGFIITSGAKLIACGWMLLIILKHIL